MVEDSGSDVDEIQTKFECCHHAWSEQDGDSGGDRQCRRIDRFFQDARVLRERKPKVPANISE